MTKAKQNDGAKRIEEMKEAFFETAKELWEEHEDEFLKVIDGSEEKCLNLGFTAGLDLSESAPSLETVLRYTTGIVTDKRKASFAAVEDPLQLVDTEIMEETAPKRGRRKAP